MRKSRAATPPAATAPQAMKGKAALSTGSARTPFRSSRERGPATATCAHWSVTEVAWASRSGPEALEAELEVRHHLAGRRGGGGEEEVVVAEPRRGAVVHDEAVLAQHDAVAHPPDGEGRDGVGVDPVEEARGVGALDVDLAEGGDVADADGARAPSRPRGRSPPASRSPLPWGTSRAVPEARLDEARHPSPSCRRAPGGSAGGRALAGAAGAEGGDRERGRRAGGRSSCRSRPRCARSARPARRGRRRRRSCPGRSPCRGWCSASCARRSGSSPAPRGRRPSRSRRSGSRARPGRGRLRPASRRPGRRGRPRPPGPRARCREAEIGERRRGGGGAAGERGAGREVAGGGAGRGEAGHRAFGGPEGGERLVPGGAGAEVGGEVERGVPAAGHGQAVDGEPLDAALAAAR